MAIVQSIGTGQIDRIEGSGASMAILIAMIILFGAASYFTGHFYSEGGGKVAVAGIVVIVVGLMALGVWSFG